MNEAERAQRDALHDVATAIGTIGASPNEVDLNGETANLVDGLFAIARAISRLAEAVTAAAPNPEDVP
jgi:hypothetical protein